MLRIALTPGEPAGIGPDLCLALASKERGFEIVTICDPLLLEQRAKQLRLAFTYRLLDPAASPMQNRAGEHCILPVELRSTVHCGQPDPLNAPYVLETLDKAVRGCEQGIFAAMVTGPVHKAVINDAGIAFSGHTEYLAEKTHSKDVVMLLAAPGLRVALVTTHVPLADVSDMITRERLERVIGVLHQGLQSRFGIQRPHILVCGLNPHAGEGGHLGRQEIEIIIPTLQALREQGLNLTGPLPADTAFTPRYLAGADAVLAMYHDQGLPVLKHMGFGKAVNVTLGLPIIRTSVDHGTGLDLAGTGQADSGSLMAALDCAVEMVHAGKRA